MKFEIRLIVKIKEFSGGKFLEINKKLFLAIFIAAICLSIGAASAAGNTPVNHKIISTSNHKTVTNSFSTFKTRTDSGSRIAYTKGHLMKISWTTFYNPKYVHMMFKIKASKYVLPIDMYITKPSPNVLRIYGKIFGKVSPVKTHYTQMSASFYYWNRVRSKLINGDFS